jgi:hypothetical protein
LAGDNWSKCGTRNFAPLKRIWRQGRSASFGAEIIPLTEKLTNDARGSTHSHRAELVEARRATLAVTFAVTRAVGSLLKRDSLTASSHCVPGLPWHWSSHRQFPTQRKLSAEVIGMRRRAPNWALVGLIAGGILLSDIWFLMALWSIS